MKTICRRLHRGDDLLLSLQTLARENELAAGVILSGVGCLLHGRVRCADGVQIKEIAEPCEIVSLTGTVSRERCHVHISLSREDLSTVGGHLVEGCTVNTTCELVIGVMEEWRFAVQQDAQTGYDEIVFERCEG